MAAGLAGIPGLTHDILTRVLKLIGDLKGPLAGEITNAVNQATGTAEDVTSHVVATVLDELHKNQAAVLETIQQNKPS